MSKSSTAFTPFVGAFEVAPLYTRALVQAIAQDREPLQASTLPLHAPAWAWAIDNLVAPSVALQLRQLAMAQPWLAAPINGYQAQYQPGTVPGSWRSSWYCPELAQALWERLASLLPAQRQVDEFTTVDWDGHAKWRPVGVNPLMRFIRYEPGGELVAHYDGPYVWNGHRRTLLSLVLYLSDASECEGGHTRFLQDPQLCLPLARRNLEDRPARAQASEVVVSVSPRCGGALVFDHRLLHDADLVSTGQKLIVRTDVVFEKVSS